MNTKIDEFRKSQPIEELERKWNKAKGRHSNRYWAVEWIDLAEARAKILYDSLNKYRSDEPLDLII